jgi:putative transposase
MAPATPRLPQVTNRLVVLQDMAYRRYLGAPQSGPPRTPASALEARSAAQRGRGGFPVGEEYRAGREERGFDGGKKVKGRKRHLLVDTEGFVLKAKVHSAKVMDYEGIKTLLRRVNERFPRLRFPRLRHLWLDAGYGREDKGADRVEKALGWTVDLVERPEKPAPEKVMMAWAREWAKEGVAVDWRRLMPPEGFLVLPRRWVVERTIAWIDQQRRMSKDYERSRESGEAFIYAAMIRLMTRRLARV